MTSWTRLTLPLGLALLGACTPTPEELSPTSDSGTAGSSSSGPTPTTMATTTMPGEDTTGTMGGTGTETTMGVLDTTVGTSTSDGDTTTTVDPSTSGGSSSSSSSSSDGGESSSSGSPPPECVVPGDCGANETCDGSGNCVPACNPWGPGDYGYCLTPLGGFNSAVLCGEPLTCINSTNGTGQIEVVVCGRTCAQTCDCPEPPPTGNAIVTCGEVIVGGSNECYLSCANGETCPDGMICRNGNAGTPLYCTHPVQPLAMYGDCGGVVSGCAAGGACATGSGGGFDYAVCIDACGNDAECDATPMGAAGAAGCGEVYPAPGDECHIGCTSNLDCLPGMTCVDFGGAFASLCMWQQ